MRLFVAVPVPDVVRSALADAVAAWRASARGAVDAALAEGLRWTRPEGWHVTVAFLGEVDEPDLDAVVAAVTAGTERFRTAGDAAGGAGLRLHLGAPGRFGARVLHVAVEDDPPGWLAALGEDVQAAIAQAGLPVQRREVRGHLTLARSTRQQRVSGVPELEVPRGSWTAAEALVEASRPQRGGARYETLAAVPLGPAAGNAPG